MSVFRSACFIESVFLRYYCYHYYFLHDIFFLLFLFILFAYCCNIFAFWPVAYNKPLNLEP